MDYEKIEAWENQKKIDHKKTDYKKMNHEPWPDETYQPAEDTYLLLKATHQEARPEDVAIEIGCGRALISREIAPKVKRMLATDINPYAVMLAKKSGLEALQADLLKGFKAKFDLIIFNPPYLPTTDEERVEGWLNRALDGGPKGRDVIFRFLEELKDHLSSKGRALLLVSSLTGLEEVKEKARAEGLEVVEMLNRRFFFENLCVLKLRIRA